MKKKTYILLYLLIVSYFVNAQQPSYYIIGEKELSGVNIYSIVQDKDANVWISSGKGLLRYDGYDFYPYLNPKMKSQSLFGLRLDNFGMVYCYNLYGQIFRIKNNSLQFYYQIPDSLLGNMVYINFDNLNNLILCSNSYFVIKNNLEIEILFKSDFPRSIQKNNNNELLLFNYNKKRIDYFKNGELYSKSNSDLCSIKDIYLAPREFLVVNNDELLVSMRRPEVYNCRNNNWSKIQFEDQYKLKEGTNIYPISESALWLVSERNGAYVYELNGKSLYGGVKLFPRKRLSCYMEDREGNVWFPTLGKGIIIVSNKDFIDFGNHPLLKKDDIKTVVSDSSGNIYVAGLNGLVYKIQNQQVKVIYEDNSPIEHLTYIDFDNSLFFNSKRVPLSKQNTSISNTQNPNTKDIVRVDKFNYFIATNKGVRLFTLNEANNSFQDNLSGFKDAIVKIKNISWFTLGRTSCLAYHKNRNEILVGTTTGLKIIKKDGTKDLLFEGKKIVAIDIEVIDGNIWVATIKNGVLVFQNEKLIRNITTIDGLLSDRIGKMKFINSKLYLTFKNGFQEYDINNNLFKSITQTDGLISSYILDFEIVNEYIWLVSFNGIQRVNFNKLKKHEVKPVLKLDSILVNNQKYSLSNSQEFSYNQNHIRFDFVAKAFRHRGKLNYEYQLIGLNNEWQSTSYYNNSIEFSYLPPRDYTFNLRAVNEKGVKSETVFYSFKISPPIWQTWWFFILFTFIGAGSTILFFVVRLKRINYRNSLEKQLKASEITAIKAQMNPHFMFNTLNSIQDLIMLKDKRASSEYLGKFADLMRKTLDASGKDFIILNEEIELLSIYLDLEKLRFGNDLKTIINCDIDDNKLQNIQLPAMLLQPYVENAIKHGLLHKKGQKLLNISFFIEDAFLICEIVDNGVGRLKSAEINQRREKYHLSFSSDANKKRIDLIKETTSHEISLNIIDLQENNLPVGTKVVFKFPVTV